MPAHTDGECRFKVVYQDHFPLKTKIAEEIAFYLLQIFLTFGSLTILHSGNGMEME